MCALGYFNQELDYNNIYSLASYSDRCSPTRRNRFHLQESFGCSVRLNVADLHHHRPFYQCGSSFVENCNRELNLIRIALAGSDFSSRALYLLVEGKEICLAAIQHYDTWLVVRSFGWKWRGNGEYQEVRFGRSVVRGGPAQQAFFALRAFIEKGIINQWKNWKCFTIGSALVKGQ